MNNTPKRMTIKEEFVKLTGDYKSGVVLDKMIDWYEESTDEPLDRAITITAQEMSEETMIPITTREINAMVRSFVKSEYITFLDDSDIYEDALNKPLYIVNVWFIEQKIEELGY